MSVDELQRGTETAWKFAYSWTSIARRLWQSPASPMLGLLTNLGYRHYAYQLHKFYTCDAMFTPGLPRFGLGNGRRHASASPAHRSIGCGAADSSPSSTKDQGNVSERGSVEPVLVASAREASP
jgi:hypothetical protein